MKVGVVIQARMSSRRLPGKVLRTLCGRPLLAYVVDIVSRGGADGILVATSTETSDNPLARFCTNHEITCLRGPLDNVARRFADAFDTQHWDAVIRVSADSPLLDHQLVAWAVHAIRRDGVDLATNIHPRTFPRGQSIEAFRREAFARAQALMASDEDQEHVTPAFYRHADQFNILNLRAPEKFTGHLAIDSPDDFPRVEQTVAALNGQPWRYRLDEIVAAFHRCQHDSVRRAKAA